MIKNSLGLEKIHEKLKNVYLKSEVKNEYGGFEVRIERKDGGRNVFVIQDGKYAALAPEKNDFYKTIANSKDRAKLLRDLTDVFLMTYLSRDEDFKEEASKKYESFSLENRTEYLKSLKSIILMLRKYNTNIESVSMAIPLALAKMQEYINSKDDMHNYYDAVVFSLLDDEPGIDFVNDFNSEKEDV